MNRRKLYAAAAATLSLQASALASACATEGETGEATPKGEDSPIPEPTLDGGGEGDASCTGECEYYPAECTDDALCFGGLFDPSSPENGLDLRTHLMAFAARAPNDAWIGGSDGQFGHFDGTRWNPSAVGTQATLAAIWLRGDAEIAFRLPSQLYTRGLDAGADAAASPDGWSLFGSAKATPPWPSAASIATSWAHPDARMLWVGAVGGSTLDLPLWRLRRAEAAGFSISPLVIAGVTDVLRGRSVHGLHGLSPSEVWVVGDRGIAARVSEAESETPTLTMYNTLTMVSLEGVWAAAPNDIWAVGAMGTVRRYRGDRRFWEIYEDLPTMQHLRAIAGSSPSDIWVVGDEASVFHFDGTTWRRAKIAGLGARRPVLEHVWAPSPGKVWIAGQGVLVSLGGKP